MSLLKVILRTDKKTDETIIAGQTTDTSLGNVSSIAKKVTGETHVSSITSGDWGKTATTQNHYVDFVDKSVLNGIIGTGGQTPE